MPPVAYKREASRDLTARQRNILEFLASFLADNGYPPTVREVGSFFGIKSTNGVSDHLRALERKGYISRSDGQSRGLRLLKYPDGRTIETQRAVTPDTAMNPNRDVTQGSATIEAAANDDGQLLRIPILGKVAAGVPLLAVQNIDDHVRVDPALVAGHLDVFGLRVAGQSMKDAGIFDGDLIFVRPRQTADNGEIVVAMIDEEVTVKRYFRELGGIRLQPENTAMRPIFIDRDDPEGVSIVGKVVGVYRQLN